LIGRVALCLERCSCIFLSTLARVHKPQTPAKCSTFPCIWIHQTPLCIALVYLKNPGIFVKPQRFYGFQLLCGHVRSENLDFSNMDLNFHLNSMPRVCGIFETTDFRAHAISRLEC
jgi:hypothetical protein